MIHNDRVAFSICIGSIVASHKKVEIKNAGAMVLSISRRNGGQAPDLFIRSQSTFVSPSGGAAADLRFDPTSLLFHGRPGITGRYAFTQVFFQELADASQALILP